MTDFLFHKAVTLTDIHFGRNSNSPQSNQDNLDFIEWFIDEALAWGADTCIMMGDWHDNRHNLNILTMDYSRRGMKMLSKAFKRVYWITGNHDLFYRDRRDISSVIMAEDMENIVFVNDPMTLGGVTFLPWLVGDEHKKFRKVDSRYIFGHLELPGFMMNARVEMPTHDKGLNSDDLNKLETEFIFSGHFHFRQNKGKVVYTGNPFPFNFSDVWDDERGMMFLQWGKDPYFKAWPAQPLFRAVKLTDLLDKPEKILRDKMTLRVTIDVDISYEEAQFIKDQFIKQYGLRKVEMIQQSKAGEVMEFDDTVTFQSVDQIVVDGLYSIQSKELEPSKLVEIYRSLSHL